MQPLQFEPIIKRARWGGRRLHNVLNKTLGPESDYAESWEIADHGVDQSRVTDGPLASRTLHELVMHENSALLGRHAGLQQFPLLVKLLDARDRLSVQVHPDDALARRFDPTENGKTEAWVVIDAEPGSRLYVGLRPGVDAAQVRAALSENRLEECLHSLPVRSGDAVFVPAGTVHAIGEGIMLAEVQQSSDLTFRLYDWGRMGSDGRPRPLHIEQAMQCIDFQRGPTCVVQPTVISEDPGLSEELVRCDHFVIRRHTLKRTFSFADDERFHVLIVLNGSVRLRSGDTALDVSLGQTVLLPAERDECVVEPNDSCVLLDAFLP
ncbi:MAG: mannose-6-phosphate isomerase [Planctomycetota bacterium]|nr:MAG: mannose-6-phosphate isomerase [Planctomycetota bacterium]